MNTFKSILILIAAFLMVSVSHAEAVVISPSHDTSFKIKTLAANKIEYTENTLFTFAPQQISNPQNISYWKVRLDCKDKIDIRLNDLNENLCGKSAKIEGNLYAPFFLTFKNPIGKTTSFSFKLKAYDKNGKWLHSEEQTFQWR